jgi:hypothetical protein
MFVIISEQNFFFFSFFFETKDSYSKVIRNTKPRTRAAARRGTNRHKKGKGKQPSEEKTTPEATPQTRAAAPN